MRIAKTFTEAPEAHIAYCVDFRICVMPRLVVRILASGGSSGGHDEICQNTILPQGGSPITIGYDSFVGHTIL